MDDTTRGSYESRPVDSTPRPPSRPGGATAADFLTFRAFITPAFVTVIWIIGAVLITLGALVAMASEGGLLSGLGLLLFGNLWWRIIMEIFIVLFRIHDSLQSIERRGRGL